jgi:cysteinyl-tRNA synthetase
MSTKYLGAEFDIHGGGLDLRFPHHENELAQSTAAGDPFARIWMHIGMLNVGGDKMSKSLGNSVFAHDLFEQYPAAVIRYFLSTAHYRSVLEFTPRLIESQRAAYDRIAAFLSRAREVLGADAPAQPRALDGYRDRIADVPQDFATAMDEDLAVPRALSVVFSTVREGQRLLGEKGQETAADDRGALRTVVAQVELMLDILGVNPGDPAWGGQATAASATEDAAAQDPVRAALDSLVDHIAQQRLTAKAEKDFATADALRDRLREAGVLIEDTPGGYRYELAGH